MPNRRYARTSLTHDEIKAAIKEATKEFLDEKLAKFGWFSLYTIASFLLAGLTIMIAKTSGFPGVK